MEIELEKIDLIRERLGVSYREAREAREALESTGGDVMQALIFLEEKGDNWSERLQEQGREVFGQLKGLIQKGQEYRIKVKQGDRVVFEVPASLGVLGIAGILASSELAVLGALGTVAAMVKNYTLEVERPGEDTVER